MNNNNFAENLKVGDLVVVSGRFYNTIAKVEKITPSGLIKVGGNLYYRNGSERGGDIWNRRFLREATPQLVNDIRIKETINKAYGLMKEAKNITFNQAKKIIDILKPSEESEGIK